jgi:hypothetical protein
VPQPVYFDHVKSDLQVLAPAPTFLLVITATDLPPSYDGSSLEVSYKLLVRSRTGAKLSEPHLFPLLIVSPVNSAVTFSNSSLSGRITLETSPTETMPSRVALHCPFPCAPVDPESHRVTDHGREIAIVDIVPVVAAGEILTLTIRLPDEETLVREAALKIVRRELFPDSTVDSSDIASRSVSLKGFAARRFSLQIPFGTTAVFTTEIATVSYDLALAFSAGGSSLSLTIPLTIGPPLVSLTKPRCAKSD